MSKAAKMYTMFFSLILILLLSTGIQPVKSQKSFDGALLASVSAPFEINQVPDSLPPLTGDSEVQPGTLNRFLNLLTEEPPVVKGVYLTSWMAGKTRFLEDMVGFTAKTEINSIVIDVKDDSGRISYPSQVPLAQSIGAGCSKFDPLKTTTLLRRNNVYPIARIVVFKDPYLANKRNDLAVKSSQGGIWRDFKGLCWVDPYNKTVWEYNIAVAKEAASYGFKEIQFDYVRFTSDGILQYCRYPAADGRSKANAIRDFLKLAYQELKPLGVNISADVFGLTCTAQGDLGIGQDFVKIAENVDIICPMVYPSHYLRGEFNLADPDRNPYQTVYRSLLDAKRKVATLKKPVIIRPWLQDFSLRNYYGREQLLAQIKAVQDAGLQEWIFWNPGNRYDIRKYRLKNEVQRELKLPPAVLDPMPQSVLPLPNPGRPMAPNHFKPAELP